MNTKRSVGVIMLLSIVSLGVSAVPALAAQGDKHGKKEAKEWREDVGVIDRDEYRRVLHDYFTGQGLPPGLAKRGSLPPGLRKHLRERGALPPGLQKRLTPLPAVLIGRLPAVPPYYGRYFLDRDLVIVDTRTDQIVALVSDVFR